MKAAGLVSLGGYLPGKEVPKSRRKRLEEVLAGTLLHREYVESIAKTGRLPGTVETNEDGWTSKPWFEAWRKSLPPRKREDPFQGAKERRRVPMDPVSVKESVIPHPMLSSDAETLAGAIAIANSDLKPEDIDLVLVSSLVPDRHVPLNASLVQHKLGLRNAGAYNVDTCCSSFITALEMAETYVRTGLKKNVLVVVSSLDTIINDKSSYWSVDTGDAAVAGIVSQVEDGFGYLASHSISRGQRHAAIIFQHRSPYVFRGTSQGPNYAQEFVTFYDQELCKEIGSHAKDDMRDVATKTLAKLELTSKDLDFFVTHQPVAWAANAWREAIGVPREKFHETFERYANIACASAPTNLLEALEARKIKAGDKVLIASSGVGENHIAVLERASARLVASTRVD
jgi:3-oxoacyl-[acyl-carrier-protein] synthase-3